MAVSMMVRVHEKSADTTSEMMKSGFVMRREGFFYERNVLGRVKYSKLLSQDVRTVLRYLDLDDGLIMSLVEGVGAMSEFPEELLFDSIFQSPFFDPAKWMTLDKSYGDRPMAKRVFECVTERG
jgi:hypothetical protein